MDTPSVGDVVIIPFPYSDLSQSKRRPALVLTDVGRSDFLLCQISSKDYGDSHALSVKESDFIAGVINRDSFIRIDKLVMANETLISGSASDLQSARILETTVHRVDMLSAYLQDHTT
jgi:mRNA interferase MazF